MISKIIDRLEEKIEKKFISVWGEIVKLVNAENDPVLLYYLSWDKAADRYRLKGDLPSSVSSTASGALGFILRRRITDNIRMVQGPLPTEKPTLAVLVPMPLFLLHAGLRELKSLVKDWRGDITVENIPYCYFTLLI